MHSTRYPLRAFFPDGSSRLVASADEELALPNGWKETPEAFTPGYVPPAQTSFVPQANAQIMQALSEIDQARMRQQDMAVQPTTVPPSNLAAIEETFGNPALELIGLKSRVGTLQTQVSVLESRIADLEALAVPAGGVPIGLTAEPLDALAQDVTGSTSADVVVPSVTAGPTGKKAKK